MKKNLTYLFPKWDKEKTRQWLMRLSVLKMVLMMSLLTSFGRVNSQMIISNLKLEEVELSQALEKIEELSDYDFVFSYDDISGYKVSVDMESATLEECLNSILEELPFEYTTEGDVVIVSYKEPVPVLEKQQEKKQVTGKVIDKNGIPLPGVSVIIKGTNTGVATNIDGEYALELENETAILIFSFVGMLPQEINYTGQTTLNVVLSEDSEQMDEVVVTGYQTISKERATGAFTTIKSDAIENKLNVDLSNVIEGMTTGLVKDSKGKITIRGTSTFDAEQEPLIVVDGFPYDGDINSLNADNIENITILKDGVAASIYGSRSANGVIVITTKKGQKGKFKVSYKATFSSTQKRDMDDLNLSTTSDYIDGQIARYDSNPFGFDYFLTANRISEVDYNLVQANYNMISREQAMTNIDKLRGNDLYKEVEEHALRNAFTQQHNLNISGGGEKNLFNASVNFFDEKEEVILSKNSRFVFDIKNTWKPKDYITFTTSANILYTKSKKSKTDVFNLVGVFGSGMQPYNRLVDDNGNRVEDTDFYVSPVRESVYENATGMKPWSYSVLDDMREGMDETNNLQARLSAQLNVKLIDGLSVTLGGVWTRGNSNTKGHYTGEAFAMRTAYNDGTSRTDPTKHYIPEGGLLDESRNINESYTFRSQINFNKSFNDGIHRVTAIAGNEIRRDQYDNSVLPSKFGYNDVSGDFVFIDNSKISPYYGPNGVDYLMGQWYSMFPSSTIGSLSYRDNRFVSWYGNGSYEFDNRFLVSGSIRLDLTNFFGTDPKYRYKPTWSAGGTYKLSNEDWFDVKFINRLNVRASYGINGNISMSEGPFMILASDGYLEEAKGVAYSVQSPANNQLRWEKTTTTNIGIDFSMFSNRVNLSVDAYKKNSVDLLAPDAVDTTTGVSKLNKNAGEITNKGLEVSLNADVVKTQNFRYNTLVNLSYNKSKVDEYNINRPYTSYWFGDNGIQAAGYGMNSLWGLRGAPLTNEGDVQAYSKDGDLIHPDMATTDDLVHLGSTIPKVNLTWSNTFYYKNFEASFMFVGSFGAKMWGSPFTGSNITNKHIAEAWKTPGDELTTVYPRISYRGSGWYYDRTDHFIQNANYVKLREVSLAYNIPNQILNKVGVSNAKLFLQARNLWTIKASGVDMDPEASHVPSKFFGDYELTPDNSRLPLQTEVYVGVSLEF